MIDFSAKPAEELDKALLLISEGCLARPVTVNKNTIPNLQPNSKGNYVIPQGTYLRGVVDSLFDNSTQVAIQAKVTNTLATATVGGAFTVTARQSGDKKYNIELVNGTTQRASIDYVDSTMTITVKLGVKSGNVITSYDQVVALINNDTVVNNLITAKLVDGFDGDTIAAATTASTAGGAEEVVDGFIDGILMNSVDVTNGEADGTMIYEATINKNSLPVAPSDSVKKALPHIKFAVVD